jgi:hypothetical protein
MTRRDRESFADFVERDGRGRLDAIRRSRPAPPSCAESAIEKQAACAAAINSSGLVPFSFSNRIRKL